MPSKSRLFSQLIAGSGQIKADRLSDDISTIEQVASTEDLTSIGNTVGDQRVINNNLYIWNGSGWYRIALINANPTWDSGGQPAASYELDADSPQDPTIITLAASDPDGITINYSYVTSGSMDSMATISQDSSIFTITPKTVAEVGEGVELTGSITFRATDGVNILPQVSSFTLNFVTAIENSKYTTLLATATGTSDNNNITDSSTNNHSITVAGDAHAGTFSPYRSGEYSWDFEGAGFYTNDAGHGESIEAENTASAFNVGTNDYSVEGWFKERNSGTYSTNAYARLFDLGPNDNISLMRNYPNTGGKKLLLKENATVIITSTNDVFDGNWHFIQVIRTGGYTKLYVDGTEEGSIASTTNINAISKIIVGAWSDYSYGFDGQIADFRFSNTARTAAVPLKRLTSDSNTKLLVCSKPYLVDESGTATSLTLLKSANGTRDYPDAVAFSPFDYDEYSATDHGGSVYFDGSGDYISVVNNNMTVVGEFTLEGWFYSTTMASGQVIFHWSDISDGNDNDLILATDGSIQCRVGSGGNTFTNSSPGLWSANTWHHFAVVRNSSNNVNVFLDGVSIINHGTRTDDMDNTLEIGRNPWGGGVAYFYGYISDFRVIKGTALYTSDFTPPTTPLSSSGTELHIKGTDASIIDKSQGSNLKLFGNTTGSTTQVKFSNTKSMYFDGTGDYIVSQEPVKFGTQDFTAECWLYYESGLELMGNRTISDSGGFSVRITSTSVTIGNSSGSGFGSVFSGTTSSLTNAWHHIAVSRSSGVTKIYVDGTSIASHSNSIDFSLSNPFVIGYAYTNGGGADSIQGWIQDFRITNGLARYTANFTPPTKSLEG